MSNPNIVSQNRGFHKAFGIILWTIPRRKDIFNLYAYLLLKFYGIYLNQLKKLNGFTHFIPE